MEEKKLLIGALVILAVLLLYILSTRPKTSTYTAQVFDGMTVAQATDSFTQQTAQIVQELKQKLSDAIAAGNTKNQLIEISDKYSDYSCALNKSFSRFQLNNMDKIMSSSPVPGPSPKA